MKFKRTKYELNDYSFSKKTLKSCYWAGFLAADGCIMKNQIQLKLKNSDIEQLKKFKKYIKYSGIIKIYDNGDGSKRKHCYLKASSPKIIKDLKKNFNITPRKSLTLKPPKKLTNKQKIAFIKGIFDGDGCKYKIDNSIGIEFLGTKTLVIWIKNTLLQNKISFNRKIRRKEGCYSLGLSGSAAISTLKLFKKIKTGMKRKQI